VRRLRATLLLPALAAALACRAGDAPTASPEPHTPRLALLELPPGDTLYQRALVVTAIQSGGERRVTSVQLVVDAGTPAEHVDSLPAFNGSPTFTLWLDTTLTGRHTFTVRGTDDTQRSGDTTFARVFFTPDERYTITALPGLGGDAFASDVNSRGDVVGWALTADSASHPVLWRGGTLHELPVPNGRPGRALHVDEAGDVIGEGAPYNDESGFHRGVAPRVWRADGSVLELGPVRRDVAGVGSLSCCGSAGDLNDRGQALGYDAFGLVTLFDIATGAATPIGNLFALVLGLPSLNDAGQVLGWIVTGEDSARPVTLAADGAPPVRVVSPWRGPPFFLLCRHGCATTGTRVGDAGEGLVVESGFRHGATEQIPVFTYPDGQATELLQIFGPDIVSTMMSRRGMLVAGVDGRDSTLWLWRAAERRTTRVAVPAGWKFADVTGVAPNGLLSAQARDPVTGRVGPVLLTPAR